MLSLLHVSASKYHHKGGRIQMNTNVPNLTDFAVFVFLHIKRPRLWWLLEAETCRRHTIKANNYLLFIEFTIFWINYYIYRFLVFICFHIPFNLSFTNHPTVWYYVVWATYNVVKQTVSKTTTQEKGHKEHLIKQNASFFTVETKWAAK